jgi:predicted sulfurtransferase
MKELTMPITPGVLAAHAHISNEEVERDIRDTEREIVEYEATLKAEEALALSHPNAHERKLAAFRASVRPNQIRERREFVAWLRRLLTARGVTLPSQTT